MPINWSAVEAKLKNSQKKARQATTVDEAVDLYTEEIIAALKVMMETASVDGGVCTPNGPVAQAKIS